MTDIMKKALELIANMDLASDEHAAAVAVNLAGAALDYDPENPASVAEFERHAAFAVNPTSYDLAA